MGLLGTGVATKKVWQTQTQKKIRIKTNTSKKIKTKTKTNHDKDLFCVGNVVTDGVQRIKG